MKKRQFIDYIETDCVAGELALEELIDLSERFPYSAAIQKVALKLLFADGDVRYDERLPLAAAVVRSRKKLYEFIHQPKEIKVGEKFDIGVEEAEREIEVASPVNIEIKGDYFEDISYTSDVYQLEVNEDEAAAVVPESGARTFSDWLKFMESQKVHSDENVAKSSGSVDEKWSLINSFINEQPEIKPSIPKEQVRQMRKDVEQSNQETEEFMTETLAQIYIKQKHYEKAIKIFEKLSLKYPEKNTYFAGQIKLIGQLKNNEKE